MTRISVGERRRALVDAALRVIERDGLTAATTRAIVSEARMSLASFHYAFASRDELLHAVVLAVTEREQIEAEAATLALAFQQSSPERGSTAPSLTALLEAGLHTYIELLVASPEHEQGLVELALHNARSVSKRPLAARQYEAYLEAATLSLRNAAEIARVRWRVPLEQAAHRLVTITDGLTTMWLATRDTAAARADATFFAQALAKLAEQHPARLRVHEPENLAESARSERRD